jgi:predicted nucleic acid-binding protein
VNQWFVDTFYLLALLHPRDEAHQRVKKKSGAFRGRFITTQWVLAEVADGCSDPLDRTRVADFVRFFANQPNVRVVEASDDWFWRGIQLFRERPDKEWSLTDCISFLVMNEFGLTEALTADHHFAQAGFTALFKDQPTP